MQFPIPNMDLTVQNSLLVLGYLLSGYILYHLILAIYNAYLHPLRSFPGPKLHGSSYIPMAISTLRGTLPFDIAALHAQYGPVVRLGPNYVSFTSSGAYTPIHQSKDGTGSIMHKDPGTYFPTYDGTRSLLSHPSDTEHARYRRQFQGGFSDKAMREQAARITQYVDLLIQQLRTKAEQGEVTQDLVAWYNWTTFDVIGELTFGKPFGCLQHARYHPWIEFLFGSIKAAAILGVLTRFGALNRLVQLLVGTRIAAARKAHALLTYEFFDHRLQAKVEHTDFLSNALEKRDQPGALSTREIRASTGILIVGGSETTSTLLAGATYYLLRNPAVLQKLVAEVRSAFTTEDEIDMRSVNKLEYQIAVLDEALRIFPPAPIGSPRVVPDGGREICGRMVPGGTVVVIPPYSTGHSAANFKDPERFVPERWLGDPEFADDDRAASKPFSVGSRNCIGRNLAYAEMRLIVARLLWNFDLELADESKAWLDNKRIFNFWVKPPLMVKLTPVVHPCGRGYWRTGAWDSLYDHDFCEVKLWTYY